MVGSFSFSVRLPFPMVSFFGYWGLFAFRLVLMAGFFVSVLISSVVVHPSLRSVWMGRLRDSLFVLRSGVVLRFSSFPARASFSPPGRSLFVLRLFRWFLSFLRFVFHPLFFPSFLFVFVPFFRLFALGSASFPFPFSLIRLALPSFPSSSSASFPHHFIVTRHRAEASDVRHGRGWGRPPFGASP